MVAIAALAPWPSMAAQEELVSLQSRPGVTVEFLYIAPDRPKAALVLLPGGPGRVNFESTSERGFLVANAQAFVGHGFAVALTNAPSDHRDFNGGMTFDFRLSAEHRTDLEAIAAETRRRANLPVWLVGISAGSISAAAYASRGGALDGVALLSSIVRTPRRVPYEISILSLPLKYIRVPLLALAHENDGCHSTPPGGANAIAKAASNSPRAQVMIVAGGEDSGGDPCRPLSYHTFNGIEDTVVAMVAQFIVAHLPH